MSVTKETVQHVANLARLQFNEEETERFSGQISRIVDLMDALSKLPTEGVKPMSHAVDMAIPQRDDVVTNGNQRDTMLANAPDAEKGHFRVPKVIE
ncbi:aspartyl/glutamyl-tRNA(Asn/Gln) amidotransferase subunit C [Magnetococcus marinus MC-1]|uniref:Aspartyl/glutamyl-tRNA(Asn/Gln) amidotransferase subunit C n=1 Tax=Magnetococcus marinus (strain ATCC BAA-1437 / JCM 17883 / MC-1) TaxID=156889 RepID=GATC_MAGMM|nr:Asp-tRNA(Asn)/Glu-tRNA(Gln) amidotransferase subunit GatC [Magnetococcus marinus]A0L5G1.1 RecName: Full=Aspartyl/glutamyl-tRNA(Asn/Gln) amidotransferase subunit C; Short=Asp/Glu-ADT subunit C [Magnetococcus marinus MC-1]ABK43204.1 aspartyl/glutamyl-tRNA(Asn/Gln) amidotransferase subunit C [Magnetococcus marinus MC-1]